MARVPGYALDMIAVATRQGCRASYFELLKGGLNSPAIRLSKTHAPFRLPHAHAALVSARRQIFAVTAPCHGQYCVLGAQSCVPWPPGGEVWRLDASQLTVKGAFRARTIINRDAKAAYVGICAVASGAGFSVATVEPLVLAGEEDMTVQAN